MVVLHMWVAPTQPTRLLIYLFAPRISFGIYLGKSLMIPTVATISPLSKQLITTGPPIGTVPSSPSLDSPSPFHLPFNFNKANWSSYSLQIKNYISSLTILHLICIIVLTMVIGNRIPIEKLYTSKYYNMQIMYTRDRNMQIKYVVKYLMCIYFSQV